MTGIRPKTSKTATFARTDGRNAQNWTVAGVAETGVTLILNGNIRHLVEAGGFGFAGWLG